MSTKIMDSKPQAPPDLKGRPVTMLAAPINDCQLVALAASMMPTRMTPAEAVDRALSLLAASMVRGNDLERKLKEAVADYNREVATRVVDTTPKLLTG